MTPEEKEDRQKYVPVHITLVPNDETRAILQKTFDTFILVCNKVSPKMYDEALKKKDILVCTQDKRGAEGLANATTRYYLHGVYRYSVAETLIDAYKKKNKYNQLNRLKLISFSNKPKNGETELYAIPLTREATIKVDFKNKICQLDLIDGKHCIPFIYPEGIPEPPDSWQACRGLIKKAADDWEVIASYENPMFPIDSNKVVKHVGVDRGLKNIAATFSKEKGYKRYPQKQYYDKTKPHHTKTEQHRERMAKDYRVAWDMVNREPEGTLFILEDLQFKKRIPGWSYRNFADWLTFFATLHHQYIDYCDPRNTSKTCPHCGTIVKTERDLEGRSFVCPKCGYGKKEYVNDDENAAENICRRGEA